MPTVYTDDLQKLFLEFMITDPELFVRARNIISPVYFSKKYFEAVSMFVEHSEKYQKLARSLHGKIRPIIPVFLFHF